MSLQISQSVALVTGANRGIGRAFVEALHQYYLSFRKQPSNPGIS